MPLPEHGRKTVIQNEFALMVADIANLEAIRRKGWQGLLEPATVGETNGPGQSQNNSNRPTDQTDGWVDVIGPRNLFCSYRVDIMRSASDLPSYVLTGYVIYREPGPPSLPDRYYRRRYGEGPYAPAVESDWTEIPFDDLGL